MERDQRNSDSPSYFDKTRIFCREDCLVLQIQMNKINAGVGIALSAYLIGFHGQGVTSHSQLLAASLLALLIALSVLIYLVSMIEPFLEGSKPVEPPLSTESVPAPGYLRLPSFGAQQQSSGAPGGSYQPAEEQKE